MAETPAATLRHAARRLRIDERVSASDVPGEKWCKPFARLLDAIAAEMDEYPTVRESAEGVGVVVLGRVNVSSPWTAALAAARAYLGPG